MKIAEHGNYPDELILLYLENDLNKEQQIQFKEWIDQDKNHKKYVYELTEIWLTLSSQSNKSLKKDLAYQQFKKRVNRKKRKRISLQLSKIAASLLLGFVLVGAGVYIGKKSINDQITYKIQSIETPLGSRSHLILQDGTVVWLNAGSKLSYPSTFTPQKRIVQLEGEAYFEVSPNKETPFIVETKNIEIEVLGTKFSVKNYRDDNNVEVILAEGLVHFIDKSSKQQSFMMQPKQQVIYHKSDGNIEIEEVPTLQAGMWISGAHFFNEQTFDQISKILEKSFDVSFIFRDEKKKELIFYGDFRPDDNLHDILDILSTNRKFKYKINEHIIEIL